MKSFLGETLLCQCRKIEIEKSMIFIDIYMIHEHEQEKYTEVHI